MRSYIFTKLERERLRAWLNGKEEDQEIRKIFVNIRKGLTRYKSEIELLSLVSNKLSKEQRLMGRVRLKKALSNRQGMLQSTASRDTSTPTTRESSTIFSNETKKN